MCVVLLLFCECHACAATPNLVHARTCSSIGPHWLLGFSSWMINPGNQQVQSLKRASHCCSVDHFVMASARLHLLSAQSSAASFAATAHLVGLVRSPTAGQYSRGTFPPTTGQEASVVGPAYAMSFRRRAWSRR